MNLFDLFATISLDSKAYEEGLDEANKETQSFGSKLKTGLAGAGKKAAAAIGAVTTAGAALGGMLVSGASDLASYGDSIDKASQKMGISAEAYQEWDAILQHSGSSIDSMSKALIGLQTKAANGSKAFEKLGLSQKEVASMSAEDLFAATIAGLQNMEEGSERTALAQQLLGGAVKELGPLLNTSAEDTEAMRKRVHELGGVLSDEAVKGSAAFQDNLQDLQTAFSGIKNGIAADMLPGLTSLMEGFTSLLVGEQGAEEALREGFSSVLDSVSSGISNVTTLAETLFPALVESVVNALPVLAESAIGLMQTISTTLIENAPTVLASAIDILMSIGTSITENLPFIITAVVDALSQVALTMTDPETLSAFTLTVITIFQTLVTAALDNLPTIISTVLTIIDNIISYIQQNLPVFVKAAADIIVTLANGLIKALPQLLAQIPKIIDNISKAILSLLPVIVETGVKLLTSLVKALPQIIQTIVQALPKIIDSIVKNVNKLLPQIIQAGITLFTSLIKSLPQIIRTIVKALPTIITSVVNGLLSMIPQIVQAGVQLLTSLVKNIPQIVMEIVRSLPQIIKAIIDGLVGAVPKLTEVGSQLIQGLWQGITNVGEWLREKISGFFGGVVSSIKNFFGIKSPSKVFAGIGEMLDRGLAKGVGDYANLAVNAAEDMAEDVFKATDRDFDFSATADVSSKTGRAERGVVINVYGAEGQDVNELAEIISQKIAFGYTQEQAVFA